MKSTIRAIMITVLLAAGAGAIGAGVGARYLAPEERRAPSMHELLHHELKLTLDQERRLEAAETGFASRRAELADEMRVANAELATAIRTSGGYYGPQVQTAVEHFHGAMGDLQKETVLHMFEMRGILTPEQAARFDQRVGEALTQDAQ